MPSQLSRVRSALLLVAITAIAVGVWYGASRFPSLPNRPIRVGFKPNPPILIRTPEGFAGLAVDTLAEAARRAGLQLEWVETDLDADEALAKGAVDLWPTIIDLPERRQRMHITRPWMRSNYFLLTRTGGPPPGSGPIGALPIPVHGRLIDREFPGIPIVRHNDSAALLRDLCSGALASVFFSGRAASSALQSRPAECKSFGLRIHPLPKSAGQIAIASTFAAALAAEKLRDQIGGMFRDGILADIITRYSYSLEDPWNTYELMQSAERSKWMVWGIALLAIALTITLWQALSLRRARKAADAANAATKQALARHRLIARVTNDALFEYDFKTGAAVCNEAAPALFGYDVERAAQMGWWNAQIHPDDRDRVVQGIVTAMRGQAPTWSDEYRFRRADGSYATVVDRVHFAYEAGSPSSLVRAVMDVSARHRLEEELRGAQKMEAVGRLAGGVAHDFNNLLTIVLGHGALLDQSFRSGKPQPEHVPIMMAAAQQAARLTQQLLAFSRRQVLLPEALNLNTVILEMEKILRNAVREGIELRLSLSGDLCSIHGDRGQIEQVVMNLCLNARDAMDSGGALTIETRNERIDAAVDGAPRPGDYAILSVSDTGCGMDSETQAHIFEPFFTTKGIGKGTGLGLSTCHGIVKQSGGEIIAISELGKGSTFTVYLPKWDDEPAGPESDSPGHAAVARRP